MRKFKQAIRRIIESELVSINCSTCYWDNEDDKYECSNCTTSSWCISNELEEKIARMICKELERMLDGKNNNEL